MEYCGGLPADTQAEGSQEDKTKLMMPAKDYEDQSHQGQLPPQALPEVVVEALAGPSGMHEVSWASWHIELIFYHNV